MIKANDIDINFTELIKDLDSIKEKLETVMEGVKDFKEVGVLEIEVEFTLLGEHLGTRGKLQVSNDFIKDRIALHCRKEYQLASLLHKLDSLGYTWYSGENIKDYITASDLYKIYGDKTIIVCDEGKITFSNVDTIYTLDSEKGVFEYMINELDVVEDKVKEVKEVKEIESPKTLCEFINSLGDMKVSAKWEDKLVVKCKHDDLLDYLCNYDLEPTCCEIEFDSDLKLEYETEEFKLVGVK